MTPTSGRAVRSSSAVRQDLCDRPGTAQNRPMTTTRLQFAILAGIAAPIMSWLLSGVVILSSPGYDPIRQSISLLANAPLGWLQTVAFVVSGVFGVAWAFGLGAMLGVTRRQRTIVRVLLLVQAALALGFAIFPTDPARHAVTTIGAVHLVVFYAYAITMPLTLVALGLVMRRDSWWGRIATPTLAAGVLLIVSTFLVPLTVDGPLTPWLGLLERIYVAIPSGWQVGAGVVAWRLARG